MHRRVAVVIGIAMKAFSGETERIPRSSGSNARTRVKTVRQRWVMVLVALAGVGALPVLAQTWVSQGPGPITNGQVSGMDAQYNPVYGAVERIAVSPTDPNTMLIGAVNGGVWRSTNALDASPNWTPVTDFLPSLSIGALTYDTANPTTVYAGIGQYSAFHGAGGASAGLFQSTNGGLNWTAVAGNSAFTSGSASICAVVANGQNILVTSDKATSASSTGLWRSTNGGLNFSQVTSGLPDIRGAALASDPTNPNRYYVAGYNPTNAADVGVWRSDNAGASWTNINNAAITAVVGTNTVNMKLSVNNNGTLFVGIVNSGQLAGVFRTQNQGASFTDFGLPTTVDNGTTNGLQPSAQGAIHFSMLADPTNDNVLYVGGDTQGILTNNASGAINYTGRLFRSTGANSWTVITDNMAGGTAPHADSRALAFDNNGNLVEGDDGGLFRRSSPGTTNGTWTAIGGSGTNGLRITEIHSVAYDSHGGVLIAGAQDTGAMQQNAHNSTTWTELTQGDGGVVGVYDRPGTNSFRYSSNEQMSGFTYGEYNGSGALVKSVPVTPTVVYSGGSSPLATNFDQNIPFYTPIAVNAVDADRLVIGTASLYESSNHAVTLTALGGATTNGPTVVFSNYVGALAYGGFKGTNGYADVLYSGAGTELRIRPAGGGFNILPAVDTPYNTAAGSNGFSITSIVLAYTDWQHGFVAGSNNRVFCTTDGGATWTEMPGLSALIGGGLDTLAYIENGSVDALFAGGLNGVFWSLGTTNGSFGAWTAFGSNSLPDAIVTSLYYDRYADVLAVGTLGRGAWTIENASQLLVPEPGTVSLLLAGCCTLIFARRRRQDRRKR